MSWRDFKTSTPLDNIDKRDKSPLILQKDPPFVPFVAFVGGDASLKNESVNVSQETSENPQNLPERLNPVWQLHIIRILKECWPKHATLKFIADQLRVTEGQLRPLVSLLLNNRIIVQSDEGYRVRDYIQGDTRKSLVKLEDLTEQEQERVAIMRHDGAIPEAEALEIVANSVTAQAILTEFPGSTVTDVTIIKERVDAIRY